MKWDLRQNLRLKVFSLLIAIVWWALVRGEDARVKDFIVPLDYVNLPESLMQAGRVVDAVTVRLRASEALLRTLSDDRLSASIDLERLPLGEQRVPVTEGMLRVPPGTEVVRISPDVVPVRIEKRARRQVPIVAEFSGRLPDGYERTSYTVDPPVATVEGPASEVAAVGRATTGTILLEGQTGSLEFEVRPIPDAPSGSRVRVVSPPDAVKVRVIIERRLRS